jgi:flavin reductase (DIM6/NTAB) family NADH-FMN oxidoreductase RutF
VKERRTPELVDPKKLSRRDRYQLFTSVLVPRPIGWISSWGEDGGPNLAPYSFFNALSSHPPTVGVSIGKRGAGLKDTLVNLRARGAFCVNIVTEEFLEAMNETSAEVEPSVDEFELAGLLAVSSDRVDAPYVDGCKVVLECEVQQEVDLLGTPNTLFIAEVVRFQIDQELPRVEGTIAVDPEALRAVGRLGGASYVLPGAIRLIPRP